jgi:NADH-quinone oxidoreductase subunit M
MTFLQLPWAEVCVALPLVGAAVVWLVRDPVAAGRWTLGVSTAAFACSLVPWVAWAYGEPGNRYFAVDGLSAPFLALVALLHLLVVLATARVKLNRMSLGGHLLAEGFRLGTFAAAPDAPGLLVLFLVLGTVAPYFELRGRGQPTRVFALHMGLFVVLLTAGWLAVEAGLPGPGGVLLLLAVLIRSGAVPAHLWIADLFEHATFGTALLYVAPLAGVYLALRLVLPIAPDWALQWIGAVSMATAVYAAGMATVQVEARRFFSYLFLSHASLVLVGLELHTALSLTGALFLWASVALSLGGLGITLRAVEARHGRLTLDGHRGLYDESPTLAVGFLLTGLGSVGFPGTIGFVAAELLVDGAISANLLVGVGVAVAAGMNGIAIVRAYLALFTGARHASPVPMGVTPRERFAVLTLAALILVGGLVPQPGVTSFRAAAGEVLRDRGDVPAGGLPQAHGGSAP